MHRFSPAIAIAFALFFVSCNHRNNTKIDPKWKKIPDNWIEKARSFSYKKTESPLVTGIYVRKEDSILLADFDRIIKPDTIGKDTSESGLRTTFNIMAADLDGDQNNELICLMGWHQYSPSLCVFKQVDNSWYLVYKEEIDTFYGVPTVYVANNYSKNKAFYLRRVYDHGSGIYEDGYSFYKLEDNRVYKCLDIINDAHIDGWGLFMNQSVKSTFEFRADADDELFVTYSYNFFPGAIEKGDLSWEAHEDISLISGEDGVE